MVRLKGQLMSLDASGSIGKTMTYSNWKGRSYAKKLSIPTDNRQATQLGVRAGMEFLSQEWSNFSDSNKATWEDLATPKDISPFNAYVGENLTRIVNGLAPTIAYPATTAVYNATMPLVFATAYPTYVGILTQTSHTPNHWTTFIYRGTAVEFDRSNANLVHLHLAAVAPDFAEIRDIPPSRGTWVYRFASGDELGNIKMQPGNQLVNW